MISHAANSTTVLHYLATDSAPAATAELATRLLRFLDETGGATTAPKITGAGQIEIHCGPALLTLRRVEGADIAAAQAALWGRAAETSQIEREAVVALQLNVSVAATDQAAKATEIATPLLAGAACALARAARPAAVQWIKPASWVTGAQFLEVLDGDAPAPVAAPAPIDAIDGPVYPRRPTRNRHRRPTPRPALFDRNVLLNLQAERVRAALTDPVEVNVEADAGAASATERLAIWSASLSQAAVSLPVASSRSVYNILQSEDMRRPAQVAAFAGAMLLLGTSGAIAQMVGGLVV